MYEWDVEMVRIRMNKAVQLAVAGKKLVTRGTECFEFLTVMEREFREAAGELQRVEKLMQEDVKRPLLDR